MPKKSPLASIDIPSCNLLSFLFPPGSPSRTSTKPIWIDAANPAINVSSSEALLWVKRLALGLDNLRDRNTGELVSKPGDVVLVFTPNHVFVPVAFLGIVGSTRTFSGVNPAYSVGGKSPPCSDSCSGFDIAFIGWISR
jgi:hypothetical protein